MRHTRKLAFALIGFALVASLSAASVATARSGAAPTNTSVPTIEGPADDPYVGDTLTASNGNWSNNPTSYSYQWDRCNAVGDRQGCGPIAGATSKAYTLKQADVDHTLRVRVTAKNADGSATKDSKGTGVVADNKPPKNSKNPTITGNATVGSTLTAENGTWAGASSFAYDWQSCDTNGNACTAIGGATGKTYGVRSADTGHTLRVKVTAKNKYGSTSSTSDRTATVTTGGTTTTTTTSTGSCNGTSGSVNVANVKLPDRLLIDRFDFSPGVVTRSTNSFTARIHVRVADGCSVSGAQLWATAIPYNQTSTPQGVTGADGWATLTFAMKSGFPANPGRQQILAVLIRATKPGDSVLAGVSTRRTVSQRVNLR